MHIIFTDDELRWMEVTVWGLPIKNGCPAKIEESINKKKKLLDWQADRLKGESKGENRG